MCKEYEKGFKQGHQEGCTDGYNKAMKQKEQKPKVDEPKEPFRDDTKMMQSLKEIPAIKGGDFITDGLRVFLVLANVAERNLGETYSTFCESLVLGVDGVVYCNGKDFRGVRLATDEERARFIHDLKVGTNLRETPAEWSEEDKAYLNAIVCLCNGEYVSEGAKLQVRDWLKSLRPFWKPQTKD